MSTQALTKTDRPSLIQAMASRYSIDPAKFIATLKATILPKATDEEAQAFCMVAHEYGLNPFLKEIHAFPNKSGGITPVVGVDGWASLMNRRPEFDGIEFETQDTEDGKPHSVTARVYIKGRSRPVTVTEFYSECARGTDPWKTMPRRMLRHKALIQAARVAFGFAGIHDEDEARDIINVTPIDTAPPAPIFKTPAPTRAETHEFDAGGNPLPSAQDDLCKIVTDAGYTLDQFNRWASKELNEPEAPSWADVPEATAKRLVKAKAGFLAQLAGAEGGAK